MTDLERRLATPELPAFDADRFTVELARRASVDGLADVAYAPMDSPMGELTVFVTPRGLVRLAYPNESLGATFEELGSRVSPRILRRAEATDPARGQLDDYFAGRLQEFDLPLDWSLVRGFARGVLAATARVPWGSVTTYRDMAMAAGSPRAARAAGNALGSNPIPIVVPCHRVLHADGGLGGYSGGLDRKRFLLALEGTLPAGGG